MAAVNSDFGIFDKTGTLLKRIDATVWFQNVLATLGRCDRPTGAELGCVFDPKVVYDHHSDRWVITYLAVNKTIGESWILLSVSDDSNPNGLWCNWALDGDLNGATQTSPGNWSDYQGMGYDNQAVYVVLNQFRFSGEFDYAKIRILPKNTIYNTSCPAITWTDLWDIHFPPDPAGAEVFRAFTIRPAVTFGEPGTEYLVTNSYFTPPFNNFMVLYKLTNPLSATPSLTTTTVTVTPTNPLLNADQKDGSRGVDGCAAPCLIEVGGDRLRNAVFRDGSVWTAHSVADGSGNLARARYVRIDVGTGQSIEDQSVGAANCWYYYPAIASDINNNMAMVFNRSCSETATSPPPEYVGIRYVTRTDGGALQLPSVELKAGETNHVRTHGGPRNRWGDYSGIAVDPAAPNSIWMFAEYAASPQDTWGTWFGRVDFNTPPLADDQTVSTSGDTPVAITLTGSDVDSGDTLSYIITALPGSGDLAEGATSVTTVPHALTSNTVTYTANVGFIGGDPFQFKVNDGTEDSTGDGTVTVNVAVPANTLIVTKTGDTNDGVCDVADCSLREAIRSGDSGDTIIFAITGTITLALGQLTIDKNLTIDGPGSADLIISGNDASRVFQISSGDVAISGVTISKGMSAGDGIGGGIRNFATLALSDSAVVESFDSGVVNISGVMTVTNSLISGDRAFSTLGRGIVNQRG